MSHGFQTSTQEVVNFRLTSKRSPLFKYIKSLSQKLSDEAMARVPNLEMEKVSSILSRLETVHRCALEVGPCSEETYRIRSTGVRVTKGAKKLVWSTAKHLDDFFKQTKLEKGHMRQDEPRKFTYSRKKRTSTLRVKVDFKGNDIVWVSTRVA